ncbi:hypothetical protein [Endozoicomonas sp.]|uniref:hypothetical protein n=1 Tax=Endozoicomonas sp. TaxID=1892382 RepID=UPI00383AB3C3
MDRIGIIIGTGYPERKHHKKSWIPPEKFSQFHDTDDTIVPIIAGIKNSFTPVYSMIQITTLSGLPL